MSGRRFFQRGHASVPTASLSTGSSGALRWLVAGSAVLALVTASAYFFSSHTEAESSDIGARLAAPLPAAPLPIPAASGPSLIGSALSKVQSATQTLSPTSSKSTGLQLNALSDAGIAKVAPLLGQAEARLIDIYRLISQGRQREALNKADQLVRDHPNFHLAHLVHGDLLSLQVRPVRQLGDVPDTKASAAAQQLAILRDESRRRMLALTERPPEGAVPSQFLALSSQSRHAIAVDASRSRLYLFENQSPSAEDNLLAPAPRFRLLGDFYISVGLSGIEKSVEGDKRTPLGVYYITSNLNPDNLPDLYGVGALPINYPNPLDVQRGKTGSGIWLHGTPREQFVRAPQASDGCVVLSNPDLEKLLSTVQIRTTPVVIAPALQWVQPQALEEDRKAFEASLEAWRKAKSDGQTEQLRAFYSPRIQGTKDAGQGWSRMEAELRSNSRNPKDLQLKDVSMLHWKDSQDTMVVTFGEVAIGQTRGVTRRQYWARERDQWKIFFEGTP
jgi:L,D-transpeptidase YnhG